MDWFALGANCICNIITLEISVSYQKKNLAQFIIYGHTTEVFDS